MRARGIVVVVAVVGAARKKITFNYVALADFYLREKIYVRICRAACRRGDLETEILVFIPLLLQYLPLALLILLISAASLRQNNIITVFSPSVFSPFPGSPGFDY